MLLPLLFTVGAILAGAWMWLVVEIAHDAFLPQPRGPLIPYQPRRLPYRPRHMASA